MKYILKILSFTTHRKFKKSLNNIEATQKKVFQSLKNESRKLAFYKSSILTYEDFSKTKIKEYEDYESGILQDLAGSKNHSVFGKIIITEKTSGTTSGSKLIPYTSKQLSHFFSLILIWVFDLMNHKELELKSFKTFISLSPSFDDFEHKKVKSDEEYLPWIIRILFRKKLLIPKGLNNIQDPQIYNEKLLSFLIGQKDLEIISIWNPTYLLTYLDLFQSRYQYYKELSARFDLPDNYEEGILTQVWPNLKLISVWGDSNAKKDFERLVSRFSDNVFFQKKGLLSTEFPVTVPLLEVKNGHLPLVNKIFFELKQNEKVYLLHQVEVGEIYALILSSPGGFHRYNTHDLIKVIGNFQGCPIFEFVGRENYSDLVGEKLSEVFVKNCIEKICRDSFTLLKAVNLEGQKYYKVLSDNLSFDTEALEDCLKENIHYKYARNINQLEPLELQYYCEEDYYSDQLKSGKKRGDIKRSYLLKSQN